MNSKHSYNLKIYNGRIKVYIDNILHLTFNQSDFKGFYSYRTDTSLYGVDIYLKDCIIELEYEKRKTWEKIIFLLDKYL